jgi:deoxycytidylate deaminase
MWFRIARECSRNSSCIRRQVGAVLVNPLHGAISFGWNLEKNGALCTEDCPRAHSGLPPAAPYHGAGECIATHAEVMAIEKSDTLTMDQMGGCHIYVNYRPCTGCQQVLDSLGIVVHYESEYA